MNPQHLLEQAERLASAGVGRPRQTDLRRAVSAAYYALFHLLTQDGAQRLTRRAEFRPLVARKYEHGLMRDVSDRVAKNQLEEGFRSLLPSWPDDVRQVASAIAELQGKRHRAEYDGPDIRRPAIGILRRAERPRHMRLPAAGPDDPPAGS